MKKLLVGLLALVLPLAATALPAGADGHQAVVTSGDDSGPGTLREALSSGATVIHLSADVDAISLEDTLTYDGHDKLVIKGRGQTIHGPGTGVTALMVANGADLVVEDVIFDDGGAYGLPPADGVGNGIHVHVPADRTGLVDVHLRNVTVTGFGGHGVWIADNHEAPASVRLITTGVEVSYSGIGGFDQDGVRVDETGYGDIRWNSYYSHFIGNGADGVELDERGEGRVDLLVTYNSFEENGHYCAPIADAGPIDPSTAADPTCVEDDDGEYVLDLDDGFDVDEAGPGSVVGFVEWSAALDNFDEGLDFDEEDDGNVTVNIAHVTLLGNTDEGMKISEEGPGSTHTEMQYVGDGFNMSDGVEIEEADEGDNIVHATHSVFVTNDNDGLKIVEEDDGDLLANLRRINASANGGDGLQLEETGAGDLHAEIRDSLIDSNEDVGLKAEQETTEGDDGGSVFVRRTTNTDNAEGAHELDGVTEVHMPFW